MISGFFSKIKDSAQVLNPYAMKGSIPDSYYHPFKLVSKFLIHLNLIEMGVLEKIIE